jgi:transposase
VPLFQPAYSPELNPVESMWHHILVLRTKYEVREEGGFKNRTFCTLKDVEDRLVEKLNKLDKETVKSITLYKWVKEAVC